MFYALPLVETDSDLTETLENTLFVKLDGLKADTSRIRIHRDYHLSGGWDIDSVKAKVKHDDWYDLSDDCWVGWERFEDGLASMDSGIEPSISEEYAYREWEPVGTVLKQEGEPTLYPDSNKTVLDVLAAQIAEQGISVDHAGFTAGMFARE